MEDIEKMFDKAVTEIERMLNTKTVVGEPITVEGATLIPLVNVGFGFGVGSGKGSEPNKGSGQGGGTGGGGGVKPVAVVVVSADGVRVEPIGSSTASVLEKVVDSVGRVAAAKVGKDGKDGKDDD